MDKIKIIPFFGLFLVRNRNHLTKLISHNKNHHFFCNQIWHVVQGVKIALGQDEKNEEVKKAWLTESSRALYWSLRDTRRDQDLNWNLGTGK